MDSMKLNFLYSPWYPSSRLEMLLNVLVLRLHSFFVNRNRNLCFLLIPKNSLKLFFLLLLSKMVFASSRYLFFDHQARTNLLTLCIHRSFWNARNYKWHSDSHYGDFSNLDNWSIKSIGICVSLVPFLSIRTFSWWFLCWCHCHIWHFSAHLQKMILSFKTCV
jgi:hypothetical protein